MITVKPTIAATVRSLLPNLMLLASDPNSEHPVWSNFEIGDLDFWRSEAYGKFFDLNLINLSSLSKAAVKRVEERTQL